MKVTLLKINEQLSSPFLSHDVYKCLLITTPPCGWMSKQFSGLTMYCRSTRPTTKQDIH